MVDSDLLGWAWLAGLLDGDGYLTILPRTTYSTLRSFRATIMISMTTREPLDKAVLVTKVGRVLQQKTPTKTGKPIYTWRIEAQQAGEACKRLLPYLTLKKPQAELIILLCENQSHDKSKTTVSPEDLQLRYSLADRIKLLHDRRVATK